MNSRAYSTFLVKSAAESTRTLTGIASTPEPDRMQDIVEPLGASFELPLPLLWQHDAGSPVGWVRNAKPGVDGIPVEIEMARIAEPGALKDLVDMAWQSIKSGLVRGLSIGFSPIEYEPLKSGGLRFTKWTWLELSAVTIPANAAATIQTIKAFDASRLRRRARAPINRVEGHPGAVKLIDPHAPPPRPPIRLVGG